jgi:hypothetical protein
MKEAHLVEVAILADDDEFMLRRVAPNGAVIGLRESNRADVNASRKQIVQCADQSTRQILVEKQLDHQAAPANRRSRSAAKASAARMSVAVNSG